MTEDASPERFQRDEKVDEAGIVGARWWQESLSDPVPRRAAIAGILVAGGVLTGLGAILAMCGRSKASPSDDDVQVQNRTALEVQKEYGWNFGAVGEALTFDGHTEQPYDPAALDTLGEDLAPDSARLRPFYVPTLFASPSALARSIAPGESAVVPPLKTSLRPISTPAMDVAFHQGRALASLFELTSAPTDVALVVDLPGPEAVAFAAGAATRFAPVFTFDNWPHPRGVVPAHLTVAAAAYYQPLFRRMRAEPSGRLPMFVLDRNRLSAYSDDATQFDNRHVVKLPGANQLSGLGIKRLLYVAPKDSDRELDDLNDALVELDRTLDVRVVPAIAFTPPITDATPALPTDAGAQPRKDAGVKDGTVNAEPGAYYYGGRPETHLAFWSDYAWMPSAPAPRARPMTPTGASYVPRPRPSAFSSGSGSVSGSRVPGGFGVVPVVVAAGTGAILGAKFSRNGSWNRSSSWSSGS